MRAYTTQTSTFFTHPPRDEGGGREEEKRIVVGEKTGMKGRMRDEGKEVLGDELVCVLGGWGDGLHWNSYNGARRFGADLGYKSSKVVSLL